MSDSKPTNSILLAFLSLSFLNIALCGPCVDAPRRVAGNLFGDSPSVFRIPIGNSGDAPLLVKRMQVSCSSCMRVLDRPNVIKEGEVGDIIIQCTRLGNASTFRRRVFIETNDPSCAILTVEVCGNVLDDESIRFSKKGAVLRCIENSIASPTDSVKIMCGSPVSDVKVLKSFGGEFDVNVVEGSENVAVVNFVGRRNTPVGRVNGWVEIGLYIRGTNTSTIIPVSYIVNPQISCFPNSLCIPRMLPFRRRITVSSKVGAIKITGVECHGVDGIVATSSRHDGETCIVSISREVDSPATIAENGEVSVLLSVFLPDGETRKLVIPVKVYD